MKKKSIREEGEEEGEMYTQVWPKSDLLFLGVISRPKKSKATSGADTSEM